MGYQLKRSVISMRFGIFFILQLAMYYYLNHGNLSLFLSSVNFYSGFLNSITTNIPLLTLFCAALVGLQTHDELDKHFQPLLFSRTTLQTWMTRKFIVNALTCGIFILLAWLAILLLCFLGNFPPQFNFIDLGHHPCISLVSSDPTVAIIQLIVLDMIRVFLFGVLLGAVATLGAVAFKTRYLALAFPAVAYILFDYYANTIAPGLSWYMNFNLTVLAGKHVKPWFSFAYFGLSALIFFALANYFVLRRVRHE